MPILQFHVDHCPCASGRIIKDCCLKPCGDLAPRAPRSNLAHLKCYARSTGDCSSTISKEHWLSAAFLRLLAPDGVLKVAGLPRQRPGTWIGVPINNFASNVLCDRHNSVLSPLDDLETRFFSAFAPLTPPPAHAREVQLFDGFDLERCFLKILCGVVSAGVAVANTGRVQWQPSFELLKVLYAGERLAERAGLYCATVPLEHEGADIGLAMVSKEDDVYGLIFALPHIRFLFTTKPPPNPIPSDSLLANATYRPVEIVLASEPPMPLLIAWQ